MWLEAALRSMTGHEKAGRRPKTPPNEYSTRKTGAEHQQCSGAKAAHIRFAGYKEGSRYIFAEGILLHSVAHRSAKKRISLCYRSPGD